MLTRTRTLIACTAAASALGLAASIAAPALASSATPGSPGTTSLATVDTQSSGQKSISLPRSPNQFIPVDSSPVLPIGAGLTERIRTAVGAQVKGPIGTIASITVSCKAGEVAVGGGGTPNDGNWATLLSRPQNSTAGTTGTPTQWRVDFGNYNDTNNAGAIPVAYAVCQKGGTGLTERIRTAVGAQVKGPIGTIASITVSCKAGEVAVGGGGTPNDGNWATLLSRPQNSTAGTTGTPTQWRVDFGNYNDTNNAGAIPVAYAVCQKGGTGLTERIRTAVGAQVKGPIGTIASITVSCKAGEVAVGGGGTPNDGNWATLLSRPQNSTAGTTGTPTQWRVDFGNYNDTNNAGAVPVAYAVCQKG